MKTKQTNKKEAKQKAPHKTRTRKTQHHKTTPLQRTKEVLEARGFKVFKTEHWNPFVKRSDGGVGVRQDLMGFCDLLAIREDQILAVQCGTLQGRNEHIKKLSKNTNMITWGIAGGRVELWSWRKLKQGWEPVIDKMDTPF